MGNETSLCKYMKTWSEAKPGRADIAATIECIPATSIKLAKVIAHNSFNTCNGEPVTLNYDGDAQKPLDILAHQLFEDALRDAPVGLFASEESEEAILLDEHASLGVAIDPFEKNHYPLFASRTLLRN